MEVFAVIVCCIFTALVMFGWAVLFVDGVEIVWLALTRPRACVPLSEEEPFDPVSLGPCQCQARFTAEGGLRDGRERRGA